MLYNLCYIIEQDYDDGPHRITFPAGTTIVYLNIPIIDDNIVEDDENFTLTINSSSLPTNIVIGNVNEITVTIANDDCKLCNAKYLTYFSSYTNTDMSLSMIVLNNRD